ncbi:MAG: CPBP family intramembrane metalloprotease [Phycisphaerales bacterium]|nr:CPBP family intramembrane metalloprotease [Phycisphaerales bacterium]
MDARGRGKVMGGRSGTHRRSASGPRSADLGLDGPFLDRYWRESRRPLTILVFLLPLVALYEVGLFVLLPEHRGILTNLAHETLLRFFAVFGVTAGLAVPAAALLVVLLVWHLLLRERWRVDPRVLGGMIVESAVLVVPLLVLGQVIARSLPALADGGALDRRIGELDLLGKLTVSLGAGIFEELVFRMLLVAVLHALLVDVGRLSSSVGSIVAVTVAAAVFTWYHPLRDDAGVLSAQRIAFFFLAGLYFGGIFVLRGFGIVVAVHALYDLAVSVFLLPQSG